MIKSHKVRFLSKLALLTGTVVLALALSSLAHAQQRFNTADAAVEALVAAARSGDRRTVVSILGPGSQELVASGDPVEDENIKKEFLTSYDAQHRIVSESGKPSVLVIGQNDWPFRPRGRSGLMLSDLFPHIHALADELCIVRSMQADSANHTPATFQENSGFRLNGFPAMGAWLSYGLGAETDAFPLRHEELLAHCRAAGQERPTPLILRYGIGDWNARS